MECRSAPPAVTGARVAVPTPWRRLIARAMATRLTAFVVPDMRIARSSGLDLPAAGLQTVTTPRHASVLLIVGDLPPGLATAAAVAYAQMPRPRVILALGADASAPLPNAEVRVALNQQGLLDGTVQVRDHMRHHAWSSSTTAFTAPVLSAADDDDGDTDAANDHGQDGHDMSDHGQAAEPSTMAGPAAEEDTPSAAEHPVGPGDGDGEHDDMAHDASSGDGHAGMDHADHMMDDGGFMSMIAMTQDLPRSRDGLPMEWVEAPFGPLFAGLPAGLAPTLTLDGDTVATATLIEGATYRDLAASLPGPVETFPDRLATLDPLAPVAYRLLAGLALEAIGGSPGPDAVGQDRIEMLERERAINHLGWLAMFGELIGVAWLAERAAEIQLSLVNASEIGAIRRLGPRIDHFLRNVDRIPLLDRRLAGIGQLDQEITATAHGPVARASGIVTDVRAELPAYRALGFVPVVRNEGDTFARFQVRLAEIGQSLDLVANANALPPASLSHSSMRSGTGRATIETPRGAARLEIDVDGDYVRTADVQTPSAAHVPLLPLVAEGAELADALAGISSLDLSPWDIDL